MPERRTENRLLCSDMIELYWKDRSGWPRTTTGLLEDVSALGVCIQTEAPIALRTEITLWLERNELKAEVCYCVYREIGYFVGLKFSGDRRWSRQLFRPKHLLDLKTLAPPSRVQ